MLRRFFIIGAFVALLGGCVSQQVPPEVAKDLYFAQTTIDMSGVQNGSAARSSLTSSLKTAMEREIRSQIRNRGNRTVVLKVDVTSANIVSAGQSLLLGGNSAVSANVSLVDFNTGEVIMQPTKVTGTGGGYAPGGIIGALSRPDRSKDISVMAKNFAKNLNIVLFGT